MANLNSNLKSIQEEQKQYENAANIFFPSIPNPPIKHALNLSSYTGTYNHPGYGITKFFINAAGKLQADRKDKTWQHKIELEHVSGEFWLGDMDSLLAPGSAFHRARFPVEFIVDSKGVAVMVGLRLESSMGDEKLWFSR